MIQCTWYRTFIGIGTVDTIASYFRLEMETAENRAPGKTAAYILYSAIEIQDTFSFDAVGLSHTRQ